MIEFFGTPLLGRVDADADQLNLGAMCGVSDARAAVFVDALLAAQKHAFVHQEQVLMPGMAPVMGEHFSLALLIEHLSVDTDTPGEILLVGLLIGRVYSEMEFRANKNAKRVSKMIALMDTDPVKALRKMRKDIGKLTGDKK